MTAAIATQEIPSTSSASSIFITRESPIPMTIPREPAPPHRIRESPVHTHRTRDSPIRLRESPVASRRSPFRTVTPPIDVPIPCQHSHIITRPIEPQLIDAPRWFLQQENDCKRKRI